MPSSNQTSPYVYLFLHVPKCMGSTMTSTLSSQVKESAHVYIPESNRRQVREAARTKMAERSCSPFDIKVLHGHSVFEGLHTVSPKQPRYFTFLREPVARRVSLYNYFRMIIDQKDHWRSDHYRELLTQDGRLMEFEEWLEFRLDYRNPMSRFIGCASFGWKDIRWPKSQHGFNLAKSFLERMHFVGFVESSDTDLPRICSEIGVKPPTTRTNVSKPYVKLDPKSSLQKRIEELDSLDLELYDYAKRFLSHRKPSLRKSA